MRNWLKIFIVLILISTITLVGCQESDANFPTETKEIANTPNIETNLPKLEGSATILMTVKGSPITIEVDGNNAPITAGNFVDLVDRGFYNGLTFHRVVKQPQPFVAQGGDPKGTGTGGFIDPDTQKIRYIPLELLPQYKEGEEAPDIIYSKTTKNTPQLKHTRGAIAMARSQMPDSASSQFYFALAEHSFLDGNYAVFGYVTNGMDIVDNIEQGDRIDSAKVINGIQNLKK